MARKRNMRSKRVIRILAVFVMVTVIGMFVWNGTKETKRTKDEGSVSVRMQDQYRK